MGLVFSEASITDIRDSTLFDILTVAIKIYTKSNILFNTKTLRSAETSVLIQLAQVSQFLFFSKRSYHNENQVGTTDCPKSIRHSRAYYIPSQNVQKHNTVYLFSLLIQISWFQQLIYKQLMSNLLATEIHKYLTLETGNQVV